VVTLPLSREQKSREAQPASAGLAGSVGPN